MDTAPFHAGELALQREAGVAERLAAFGSRVIRDHLPEQHQAFFPLLPFLLLAVPDDAGRPLIGLVAGAPGFAHAPDARSLRIDALPLAFDPTAGWLREGAAIGLLGIEQHTRRRNRLNGRVVQVDRQGFTVQVGQSFGNCPRYIQARRAQFVPAALQPQVVRGESLDAPAAAALAAADTFFIASAHPQAGRADEPSHGVDVSHRGGRPGFVHVDGDLLTVPDFAGNNYFNTLGNLVLQPRCQLLVLGAEDGAMTWVAADARVVQDATALAAVPGAQRLLQLRVRAFQRVLGGLPLHWGPVTMAPELVAMEDGRAAG
jgi:hypothetical protein